MKTNIRNKNGELSAYGFACGYIQWASNTGKEIDMWKNGKRMYHEGSVYQVKHFKDGNRIAWESFENLGAARKYYKSISI